MKTDFIVSDPCVTDRSDAETESDRMENMRELLADLRTSIETQRHLIDVSRALLERS